MMTFTTKRLELYHVHKCHYNSSMHANVQDVSSMLVALDPNGSLIFAAKNDSTVNVVQNATQNDWSSLKASTKPSEIFRMPGQIFGYV